MSAAVMAGPSTADREQQGAREFAFNSHHFELIRALVTRHTGIVLSDIKRELVYGRLSRRLRRLGLESFDAYCDYLQQNEALERDEFINAITTNLTSFFREPHHFELLGAQVLPELATRHASDRRVRLWSAGCSSGEEPYSLAMVIAESAIGGPDWNTRLLATDIDTSVLDKAQTGIYTDEQVGGIADARRRRWFQRGTGARAGSVRVCDELRRYVAFRQLNLLGDWPFRGPFDTIFCRNVVIYFDKPTQRVLFDRYADLLVEGGWLFVGHSETLFKVSNRFESVGRTVYRKLR